MLNLKYGLPYTKSMNKIQPHFIEQYCTCNNNISVKRSKFGINKNHSFKKYFGIENNYFLEWFRLRYIEVISSSTLCEPHNLQWCPAQTRIYGGKTYWWSYLSFVNTNTPCGIILWKAPVVALWIRKPFQDRTSPMALLCGKLCRVNSADTGERRYATLPG